MYYYGGNSGSCPNTPNYTYPMYGYTGGYTTSAATVLVLFILLVIILGSRTLSNN